MTVTDQMHRSVTIPDHPQRIISLVPSQTELLHDLGLGDRVVGITKFCIHPEEWFRSKTRVGGTKKLDLEKIRQLQPDLIIGNKEENEKAQIEELARDFPVWLSDVRDLRSACHMIQEVGRITGTYDLAIGMIKEILDRFHADLKEIEKLDRLPPSVAYFIWRDPLMVACGDTFITDMLSCAGFINSFITTEERYTVIEPQEVLDRYTDLIFLSSEPYPFKEEHVKEFEEMHSGTPAILVDGEMFSWYGSRLLQAPAYFKGLRKQIAGKLSA